MAFVAGLSSGSFVSSRVAKISTAARRSNGQRRCTVRAIAAPPGISIVPATEESKNEKKTEETEERKYDFPEYTIWLSKIKAKKSYPYWMPRQWIGKDFTVGFFIFALHLISLAVPFTMSWASVKLFTIWYIITGMFGITLTYHRLLSHRSFQVPKVVEYFLAYCGVLAGQGDPLTWVKDHRHHHKYCDTLEDVHTPREGFWWSHAGWLLNNFQTEKRTELTVNTIATDMEKQWFYRFLKKTYGLHMILSGAIMWYLFGFSGFVWAYAFRAVWVYHITWLVNSASHVWGFQSFKTGDISMNNWWVGILAFGEGWHNNHHAFEYSARHGLEWWQYDPTYYVIKVLQWLGIAKKVKLPSKAALSRLAVEPTS